MVIDLLIIDTQYDFCNPAGSLYVPGADTDCDRLASFIRKNEKKIGQVHVTLDTHFLFHIAHPLFWKDRNGKQPSVFTTITLQDFEDGMYRPVDPAMTDYAEAYLKGLQNGGRYQLIIWPPHCLLGSKGWILDEKIFAALEKWEELSPGKITDYILKGKNSLTEHYSAVRAEIPVESDPTTQINRKLIGKLEKTDMLIVAGEALSHCVANTLCDLFNFISPNKITLLSDCTSNVSGFEKVGKDFIVTAVSKGMKLASADMLL